MTDTLVVIPCGAMDGKVIGRERCKTWNYYAAVSLHGVVAVLLLLLTKKIGERVAKDAGGTNYGGPADMTFEQWYEKYVKGKGASNVEGNNKNRLKIGVLGLFR